MEDDFKIYVDRLREGAEEAISFTCAPNFVGIPEEFKLPVEITGHAYLAKDHLILRLSIITKAELGCVICNEPCEVPIVIKDFYHTEELAKIPHFVFNFEDLVRDTILLQLPHSAECCEGQCPNRENLAKYFSKKS